MNYYDSFRKDWVPIYAEQYKYGTNQERAAIKSNVFKNIHFSTKQKEEIWNLIIKKSGYLK